jgi:hypothetical protein
VDLNHGPPELQSGALPLSYVSCICAACASGMYPGRESNPVLAPWRGGMIPVHHRELCVLCPRPGLSPAGFEPACSKAWDLEAHSLDQLGHSDCVGDRIRICASEEMAALMPRLRPLGHTHLLCTHLRVNDAAGERTHPNASSGNRTLGGCLEGSYVTTTPIRLCMCIPTDDAQHRTHRDTPWLSVPHQTGMVYRCVCVIEMLRFVASDGGACAQA